MEPDRQLRHEAPVKASRYNLWVNEDGADFLYNGMSGSLLKLGAGERQSV